MLVKMNNSITAAIKKSARLVAALGTGFPPKAVIFIAGVMLFTLIPIKAYAFKVDTHVWVGQQIINDLADDGMLSIKVGTQVIPISVSADVKNAILGNQAAYRMGNIGPDAFPDILSGQTAVHPGTVGGWKTDDWLSWIKSGTLSDDAKAFSYGYLAHASADTFAHTYVNSYAGDIFKLFDGEIDVETRHIVLESFIAQHTPPLLDYNGTPIGRADQVLAVPAEFLRDRLILNGTAADQNRKAGMYHLYLVHKQKERLQKFIDGPLKDIEIFATQMAVLSNTGIDLNNQQAQQLLGVAQQIHDVLQNEITGSALDELQRLNNQLVDLNVKVVNGASEAAIKINNEILSTQANMLTLNGNLIVAVNKVNELQAKLDNAVLELGGTALTVAAESCEDVCKKVRKACGYLGLAWCWKSTCDLVCKTIEVVNDAYTELQRAIADLHEQIDTATSDRDALKNAMRDLAKIEATLVRNAVDIHTEQLRIQNDVLNATIDLYQVISADINPIRALMQNWINDINSGMREYTVMSGEVIKQTMVPSGKPFDPVEQWICQWGVAVVGVPSALTVPGCSTIDHVQSILSAIDKIERTLANINPLHAAVERLKQRIIDELKNKAEEVGYEIAQKITGVDVEQLMEIIQQPGSDASVNAVFEIDNSGKYLLKISDIATVVKNEMFLTPQGYFDPDRYAVVSNALTLAKLSLLNSQQLNAFVNMAGVSSQSIYKDGAPLYGVYPDNILIKALRSIDGDYQWMGTAPPYPRQAGHLVTANENERQYGYLFDGNSGMRIWNDPQAMDRVFRKIFKGPLNPGLLALLPSEYTFKPCASNPFPLSTYDQTCVGGTLDDDGLSDSWELTMIGTLAQGPTDDPDEDGLSNAEEFDRGTNPIVRDTDSDGIPDGAEVTLGYNPLLAISTAQAVNDGLLDPDGDGLTAAQEIAFGTNPIVADTDGDGLNDNLEFQNGTNPWIADTDGDGLPDIYEVSNGLNPTDESEKYIDSDGDGLSDLDEYNVGSNPHLSDTDSDGLSDWQELLVGTNPLLAITDRVKSCKIVCTYYSFLGFCVSFGEYCITDDRLDLDSDGLNNVSEFKFGSNPLVPDTDGDGLLDRQEYSLGTDPTRSDTDGDGLSDSVETSAGTDPRMRDSDQDSIDDAAEIRYGLNPTINDASLDPDGDELTNLQEIQKGTNWKIADTDGDGYLDGQEITMGRNPLVNEELIKKIMPIIIEIILSN